MKNEEMKKVNEVANANEAEVLVENERGEAVEEVKAVLPIFVERRSVRGNDGRVFWNYFVRGTMMGKEVRADLQPADYGAYEQLDGVFADTDKVLLSITKGTRTDNSGKKVKFTSYAVIGKGDYGIEYSIPMKRREASDLTALEFLIKKAEYEAEHPDEIAGAKK